MRVLQIGSDRSKRGDLVPGSTGAARQDAYARAFGTLDDISFSLQSDGFTPHSTGALSVYPTNSFSKLLYGLDAIHIARSLPRPDIISAQDPFEAGLLAYLIARSFKVPLHVQVHTDLFDPAYAQHSILNRIRLLIARFVLPRASTIRVVSERIKDSLLKAAGSRLQARISVLPIFADIARLKSTSPDSAFVDKFSRFSSVVLFVGRLEAEKNPALALQAFAVGAPANACLILVGDGSLRKSLQDLAARLGISDRVFFEGERESAPYYAVGDLLLVTSRYEGYGLVIVEALASGIPVLSTDVGIAREAGALIAAPDAFADALREWFLRGARSAHLAAYPYATFDEYVAAYVRAVAAARA
jgi:glycosyltransferase involved in cell wall biosynthesis